MYRIRNTTMQKTLLEQERRVFRTTDFALLWEMDNRNTLFTTIKRYAKRGIIYRLQKGLYSTMPINKLDIYEIGCAISGPLSYISAETILQKEGIIFQNIEKITIMGSKKKEFEINGVRYLCHHLNPRFLINREGITDDIKYSVANMNRAIADTMYLNPKYYFDNNQAVKNSNWQETARKVGYL